MGAVICLRCQDMQLARLHWKCAESVVWVVVGGLVQVLLSAIGDGLKSLEGVSLNRQDDRITGKVRRVAAAAAWWRCRCRRHCCCW